MTKSQRKVVCTELNLTTYYGNLSLLHDQSSNKYKISLPSHSSDDEKEISKELAELLLKEIGITGSKYSTMILVYDENGKYKATYLNES